jgi:hypothetical protein
VQLESFDLVEELESVIGADVHVEQHDVRRPTLELAARLGQRRRFADAMAVELEVDAAEQA